MKSALVKSFHFLVSFKIFKRMANTVCNVKEKRCDILCYNCINPIVKVFEKNREVLFRNLFNRKRKRY